MGSFQSRCTTPEEVKPYQDESINLLMAINLSWLYFALLWCLLFSSYGYVRSVSDSHKEQVSSLTKNIKDERGIHYKLLVEERKRSDRRERELFINLEKNTEQLEGITTILKKVQFSYASLENKIMQNFKYLESEIENVKMQVTKKEGHE
ncbi:hypothetical protein PDL07_24920 [Bacillus cereus]|uniref:hypothetical protein n=1 Tax=Bacillus cereus TaxID=1396 RepID=UPI002ACB1032|nr:hypothetical protein [Bacillus cereus]MDA1785906.1 hypothetical protein [Bacillus cereus]